jgi:hypothetical protein
MSRTVWGKEFNYSFTISELVYLLFKKKECRKCGCDLIKYKDFEKRTEIRSPLFRQGVAVKDYKYHFVCTACESLFSLTELASK